MTDVEKAHLILSSFPGRNDCFGAGKGTCIKKPLTESVVLRHVLGRVRIGVYPLRKDSRTGVLAVDIDEDDLYAAIEYCDRCQHYGLPAYIERSRRKGYHLWWFFAHPVSARRARLVANCILDECNLLDSVEVFPKQDFLGPGKYGSYINLPEFGPDVGRGRTVFLNPRAGYDPHKDQWAFLASVAKISEGQMDEIIKLNDLDKQPVSQIKAEERKVVDYEGIGLPCFARMMREGVEEGMRNEATLRLATGLYRTGIPKGLGLVMLREWNKRNRPPLDDAELEKAVSNGYVGIYGYGCFSTRIQRFCDPRCPIFRKHNRDGNRKRGQ